MNRPDTGFPFSDRPDYHERPVHGFFPGQKRSGAGPLMGLYQTGRLHRTLFIALIEVPRSPRRISSREEPVIRNSCRMQPPDQMYGKVFSPILAMA